MFCTQVAPNGKIILKLHREHSFLVGVDFLPLLYTFFEKNQPKSGKNAEIFSKCKFLCDFITEFYLFYDIIELYSIGGNKIATIDNEASFVQSSLQPGVYIVKKIYRDGTVSTFKFMK